MKLLVLLLCIIVVIFIGLEATPCSLHKKREMLRNACGNFRRKRGFAGSDSEYYQHKHHRHHKTHNHVVVDELHLEILANDTTGGILIRNKRGGISYCCLASKKNCTGHFIC